MASKSWMIFKSPEDEFRLTNNLKLRFSAFFSVLIYKYSSSENLLRIVNQLSVNAGTAKVLTKKTTISNRSSVYYLTSFWQASVVIYIKSRLRFCENQQATQN